jgi:hypothetical protein
VAFVDAHPKLRALFCSFFPVHFHHKFITECLPIVEDTHSELRAIIRFLFIFGTKCGPIVGAHSVANFKPII